MAKNPPPPPADAGPGHNFSLTREQLGQVEEWTRDVQALEGRRSAINDQIAEKRGAIKALGIDMDAWRAAKRRKEMDPEDRANFDRSQAMVNAALGIPIQGDLFQAGDDAPEGGNLPSGLH